MILEEFVSFYHKNKNKKKQVKEILLNWLKLELKSPPQKNYQKVIHNELMISNEDSIIPKNKQGENLLNSLIRMTNILEEKEFESWTNNVKPKDFLHA
ncbi:MAG: hypothetical protein A3B68_02270 [Candidatus Melainabacteria bacterium RIFCSPHIGHO2_02_FULL_34_12]|nr:MAG: hypothetical protein A3B68_02270 [Candidatus Melainabacteria bacterium RIFCSPHIGHO2_02_FULL_34_12]